MPPKIKPNNREKLAKQRNKLAKAKKDRKKKMKKKMEQMAAAQKQAEDNLKKFRKMKLQIEIDKNRKKNRKFNDLKVASTIAEALNNTDDDDFGDEVIALLQELESVPEEKEEEGISIGKLKSALRTAKAKKDKKNKNLLMKGKLKVWGDNPPNGLKLDSLLRRHTRGGRKKTRKRKKKRKNRKKTRK